MPDAGYGQYYLSSLSSYLVIKGREVNLVADDSVYLLAQALPEHIYLCPVIDLSFHSMMLEVSFKVAVSTFLLI